jgi:hypothetical protein
LHFLGQPNTFLVQESLVDLGLTVSAKDGVTITLSGPSDGNWFGVGFNTRSMANSPYAIVVDGSGEVTENVLGDHRGETDRGLRGLT